MSDLTPSPWKVRASLRALSVYRSYTPPATPDPVADESEPVERPLVKGVTVDPGAWLIVILSGCVVVGWCVGMLIRGVLL